MTQDFKLDANGCARCNSRERVKARFGLAWVAESPDCPDPEPIGWQVEFIDTPSKVEQNCKEMVNWINCPPLPKCEPCPPEELCCNACCNCNSSKKGCPSGPKPKPCQIKQPSCFCKMQRKERDRDRNRDRDRKKCCCCGEKKPQKWCPPMGPPCSCGRNRSPRRESPSR